MRYALDVFDLLDIAAEFWPNDSADLVLIGGLAVRVHLGELARSTGDIDCVAMTPAAEHETIRVLRATGWTVGDAGAHRRARRVGAPTLVDIFSHPVIHPRTYETMALRATRKTITHADRTIAVAATSDLAFLKLCAARDQDLVDVALLSHHAGLDAALLEASAIHDDIEIRLAEGAAKARTLVRRGDFATMVPEILGRVLSHAELQAFEALLLALEGRGF